MNRKSHRTLLFNSYRSVVIYVRISITVVAERNRHQMRKTNLILFVFFRKPKILLRITFEISYFNAENKEIYFSYLLWLNIKNAANDKNQQNNTNY